jgi:uncharacterized membrane protein YcaP (DUF421 family)
VNGKQGFMEQYSKHFFKGVALSMTISEMLVRTLITFIVAYILCRMLGKKLISQMTFFDFVAGISIGTIIGSIMFSKDVKLTVGLIGLIFFFLIVLLIDFLVVKSFISRKIFNGESTMIIKQGKILEEGMRKVRLNMDELLLKLRKKNVFYLDEVEMAIFETDGSLSVLKKSESLPVTRKDLSLTALSRGQAQALIIDGQKLDSTLTMTGKNQEWLDSILQAQGISNVSDVFFAQVDEQNNVYIDIRDDKIH